MKQRLTGTPCSCRLFLLITLPLFVFTLMISAPGNAFAAVGLEADGNRSSTAYVSSDKDISLTGDGDKGVYAHDGGTVSLDAGVRMSGDRTTGARAEDNGSVHIKGGIKAEGGGSTGLSAEFDSSADIYGGISAAGDGAMGVTAANSSSARINGGVRVEGAGTWGIITDWRSSVYVSGGVYVSGDHSFGLFSGDSSDIFIKNGSVKVYGVGSTALLVDSKGRIHLDNIVASADGALLSTGSGGSLNALNGSSLYGNVSNTAGSYTAGELNINLSGGSSITGVINDTQAYAVTNITLSGPGDAWLATGESEIEGGLANNGRLDYSSADMGTTVTVGSLSGSGIFAMKADISGIEGDCLIVTGASAGSHIIELYISGGPATTVAERLTLVETTDGNAVFALKKDVEFGGHIYSLRQSVGEIGAVWELYRVGTRSR